MQRWIKLLLICFALAGGVQAQQCLPFYTGRPPYGQLLEMALKGEDVDSFDLLVELERLYNRSDFIRPVEIEATQFVRAPLENLTLNFFGGETQNTAVQKLINYGTKNANWYAHPYNTHSDVPYFYKQPVGELEVFPSASRSVFARTKYGKFSFKMSTDKPLGPKFKDVYESSLKSNMEGPLKLGKIAMTAISGADTILNPPENLKLINEIAIVESKAEKRRSGLAYARPGGYMIRNLDFLDSKDHYYIPAFSLPTVGVKIAEMKGRKFATFWKKNYAELLGKVKAQLLIHYGLIMTAPHAQNILIETDRNFNPTGRILLRDIDNMSLHMQTYKTMKDYRAQNGLPTLDIKLGALDHSSKKMYPDLWSTVELRWKNFSDRVKYADNYISILKPKEEREWEEIHYSGFASEVAKLLGISPKDVGTNEINFSAFFSSTYCEALLKEYYQRNSKN